jgi:hypothetical protein
VAPRAPGSSSAAEGAAFVAVPGLLARVFGRLPLEEQAFTVAALSREWRGWAAPWGARLRSDEVARETIAARDLVAAPLWLVKAAWPALSSAQRSNALQRAPRAGKVNVLAWAHGAGSEWDARVCAAAADGGRGPAVAARAGLPLG